MYDWQKSLSENLTDHPKEQGMTYREHCLRAFFIGIDALLLAIIFMVHAFFPFAFATTGSDGIKKLADHFRENDEQATGEGLSSSE